jgi:hypothetical protein
VAASGVGNMRIIEGIMNKLVYVNILSEHMKTCAENLGIQEHFAFYHDNGKKHSSHLVPVQMPKSN